MTFEIIKKEKPKEVQQAAQTLRDLIFESLDGIEENIYGGKKVQNALYSKKGDTKKVVCGIQTNQNFCIFYLHKTEKVDCTGLKLEGSGKHAKHVKFASANEIDPKIIRRILKDISDIR
jgi:hypothetical protein